MLPAPIFFIPFVFFNVSAPNYGTKGPDPFAPKLFFLCYWTDFARVS